MTPVEIITREVEAATEYDAEVGVGRGLARLHAAGWRIVKTGADGVRFGSKPHVAISEEWTP